MAVQQKPKPLFFFKVKIFWCWVRFSRNLSQGSKKTEDEDFYSKKELNIILKKALKGE